MVFAFLPFGFPQVTHHRAASAEVLQPAGLGPCCVTVQCRTTLFPHNRARLRNTTPNPAGFFTMLAEVFAESLATDTWVLPDWQHCLAAAAALALPAAAVPQAEAVPEAPAVADPGPATPKAAAVEEAAVGATAAVVPAAAVSPRMRRMRQKSHPAAAVPSGPAEAPEPAPAAVPSPSGVAQKRAGQKKALQAAGPAAKRQRGGRAASS